MLPGDDPTGLSSWITLVFSCSPSMRSPSCRDCKRLPERRAGATMSRMKTLRARVEGGKLVPDQPTTLPAGAVGDLAVIDEGDELDAEERAALHAAISESWESLRQGEGVPAEEVLRELDDLG